MTLKTLSLTALLFLMYAPVYAQSPPSPSDTSFPFVIPWDDASPGTTTDVSFLNDKPAGSDGYIVVKGGHFVESKTGQRIRFLGMNFAASSAFPAHTDADKIVPRVAKLGINIVRLTMFDNPAWGQGSTLLDLSQQDTQHMVPAQLDKLDYLISLFEKNGIYVNINLHVGRSFTAADGLADSVSQVPIIYDDRVDQFDSRMIRLQKKYASDLLTHVNPYTNQTYAEDPAVAVVEITNEDSLVGPWWNDYGTGLDKLPDPFESELKSDWNTWLTDKYGDDATLQADWQKQLPALGAAITMPGPWIVDQNGDALVSDEPGRDANNTVYTEFDVSETDRTWQDGEAHFDGLDLKDNTVYTATFWAKADADRDMPVNASVDDGDYSYIGLDVHAQLTTDWKQYSYTFTTHGAQPDQSRLDFVLANKLGSVFLTGVTIQPGAANGGLSSDQTLAYQTINIPANPLKPEHDDWIAFLSDTEKSYADDMRSYLKDTLKVHANIVCSQISFGGLNGTHREEESDFADNHSYWQYPVNPPGKDGDWQDWTIGNTPMVTDLANGGGGAFRDPAEYRVAGKPYSLSEYNEPAPNDYRAECVPELAAFAAFQDWDMIYLFAYGGYYAGGPDDYVNGTLWVGSDTAKMAFLPAAAMIFRESEFPAAQQTATLNLYPGQIQGNAGPAWQLANDGSHPDLFNERLALAAHGDWKPSSPLVTTPPAQIVKTGADDDASEIHLVQGDSGARYQAASQSCLIATGYLGGQSITLGGSTLTFPAIGNNFAAITVTAMDQKPLATSHKILVTLIGKVENQDMGWNDSRTSVGGNWGHGPMLAEGIPATIALKTAASAVWALDDTGQRTAKVPATSSGGVLTFTVGPQYKTVWYEIDE